MLFVFEQGLLKSPQYIPMFLRMKLALASSSLTPSQWEQLSPHEKAELLTLPGVNVEDLDPFSNRVHALLRTHQDAPLADGGSAELMALSQQSRVSPALKSQMDAQRLPHLSDQQWNDLSPLQRFTLVTIALSPGLHEYLGPALREFEAS